MLWDVKQCFQVVQPRNGGSGIHLQFSLIPLLEFFLPYLTCFLYCFSSFTIQISNIQDLSVSWAFYSLVFQAFHSHRNNVLVVFKCCLRGYWPNGHMYRFWSQILGLGSTPGQDTLQPKKKNQWGIFAPFSEFCWESKTALKEQSSKN